MSPLIADQSVADRPPVIPNAIEYGPPRANDGSQTPRFV